MSDLTLHVDAQWTSPWAFHALVALEEKRVAYKVETVRTPLSDDAASTLRSQALIAELPALRHRDLWITQSSAISEYLDERFLAPDHPRLLPADVDQRTRARQLMAWLRTALPALDVERPTQNVFGRPTVRALTPHGKRQSAELVRVAVELVRPGRGTVFDQWSIADADLALALMRLLSSQDRISDHLVRYALAQWDRRSVRTFIAHVPTTP